MIEVEDCENTSGAHTLENFKNYSVHSVIFNLAEAWKQIPISTLGNAWKVLLCGSDIEADFVGFVLEDFVSVAQQGSKKEVAENEIADWIQIDANDLGTTMKQKKTLVQV